MKTLYMVRHAKSSWKYDVQDHSRPLKERGKKDCKLVTESLRDTIKPPQRIITSDAIRAMETANYFKQVFNIPDKHFISNHNLYDFNGQNVMNLIQNIDNSVKRVMIVGHNHAFTSVANMLGNLYIENVPTCGFVMLQFEVDSWSEVSLGKTVKTLFPRDLK